MEGGGGIRGFAGRALTARRVAALNLGVGPGRLPVSAFADLGRAQETGVPFFSGGAEDLADLGAAYRYGPVAFAVPLWVSRPPADERPWEIRWFVSLDLSGIHPWW